MFKYFIYLLGRDFYFFNIPKGVTSSVMVMALNSLPLIIFGQHISLFFFSKDGSRVEQMRFQCVVSLPNLN